MIEIEYLMNDIQKLARSNNKIHKEGPSIEPHERLIEDWKQDYVYDTYWGR